MNKFSKRALALGVSAAVLAGTGVAYAYWTTSGGGTGTASAKTANGTVTLYATLPTNLAPGNSGSVTFTASNSGATDLYVGDVHLASVSAVEVAPAAAGSCDTSWFTMPDVTSDTVVPAGASHLDITGTGTLTYANAYTTDATPVAINQDGCKGAAITLHLTSN